MRHGPLYSTAVLRPLALQLVASLDVRSGDVVCDLLSEGVVAVALREATGAANAVVDATAEDVADAACQHVVALFTSGFAGGLEATARRVAAPNARIVFAVWDPDDPPAHESALQAALVRVMGRPSPYVDALLRPFAGARSATQTVHDVARFDGFAHCWAALTQRPPLAAELSDAGEVALRDVADMCRAELDRYATSDGSLRIPVRATLVSL